jgi:hypothetical protein
MLFLAGRLRDDCGFLPCRPLGGTRRSSILFVGWNQGTLELFTLELLMNSRKEVSMKNWFPIMAFLVAVVVVNPANARPGGCVKGAIVGGISGWRRFVRRIAKETLRSISVRWIARGF